MSFSEHRLAGLLAIWVFVVANLSGCATIFDEVNIPEYAGPVNVYPSPEHVSVLTEIPAGDNLVENSQVFVARDKKLSPFLTGLGVMIEAHSKLPDVQHKTATLSVRFNALLIDIIDNRDGSPGEPRLQIVSEVENADIVLLPSVRLDSKNLAHANFRLTIRFINPDTKQKTTKDYYIVGDRTYSLAGNDSW
jgi:hypothetical protein